MPDDGRFKLGRAHLYGWKAIAAYLGCSVSTVKKLHYEGGMPIWKHSTGGRYIIPAAIDLWLATRQSDENPPKCPFCSYFSS